MDMLVENISACSLQSEMAKKPMKWNHWSEKWDVFLSGKVHARKGREELFWEWEIGAFSHVPVCCSAPQE